MTRQLTIANLQSRPFPDVDTRLTCQSNWIFKQNRVYGADQIVRERLLSQKRKHSIFVKNQFEKDKMLAKTFKFSYDVCAINLRR